jgi:drug/metabolite transporter (DMT)-like permease
LPPDFPFFCLGDSAAEFGPLRHRMRSHLRVKTYFAILLMIIFGPLGNVMLGKGMKRIGEVSIHSPAQIFRTLVTIFSTAEIWIGIAFLITFFLTFMLVLSWADYTFVQPSSSVSYGMVALLSHFLLREAITPLRWLGVLVICLGVFIVSWTPPRTTGGPNAA